MLQKLILPILLLIASRSLSGKGSARPNFARTLNPLKVRMDPMGSGLFQASRTGGRKHAGIDLVCYPGQIVASPINGKVTRISYPYADDLSYQGMYIEGSGFHAGYSVKIFYVFPNKVGKEVTQGEPVGFAQQISKKYGASMQDHVHIELYQNGRLVDPSILI